MRLGTICRANGSQEVLTSVSLYYLTDTFPRCIYPYRGVSLHI